MATSKNFGGGRGTAPGSGLNTPFNRLFVSVTMAATIFKLLNFQPAALLRQVQWPPTVIRPTGEQYANSQFPTLITQDIIERRIRLLVTV